MNDTSLAVAFVAIGFAAMVKGAIGFGFPLISVPVVASILDPRTAVVVISIPTLFSNLLIIVRGGGTWAEARRLAALMLTLVLGTVVGAQLLARLDVRALSVIVGLTAVVFAALYAMGADMAFLSRGERYLMPLLGAASGLLGGTTNIYGPVLTSYLLSLRLNKKQFVFWLTLLFSVGSTTQVISFFYLGLYSDRTLAYSLLACIPMGLGLFLGLKLQARLPQRVWNTMVLAVILLSGLNLSVRGLVS